MKVHASSLASVKENYSINLNEQYKKYSKQFRTESGKYEYDVQVQKIGNEKMFGYNCVHVNISYTLKALGQTSHEQDEEWYSADVPGAQYVLIRSGAISAGTYKLSVTDPQGKTIMIKGNQPRS